MGGDEFVALCPNATEETCREIVSGIHAYCFEIYQKGKPLSISLGFDVAQSTENFSATMDRAEKTVYLEKKMNRSLYQRRIIEYILDNSMDTDQINSFCRDSLCLFVEKVARMMDYSDARVDEVIDLLKKQDVKEFVFEAEFFSDSNEQSSRIQDQ